MSNVTSVGEIAERLHLAGITVMAADLNDPHADELLNARLALINAADELLDRYTEALALLEPGRVPE